MNEENGIFIWVISTLRWQYDEANCLCRPAGFSEPCISFTIPEMAEEWLRQKQVVSFRAFAQACDDVSLYCNFVEAIMRYIESEAQEDKLYKISLTKQEFYQEKFFREWNINPENHKIDLKYLAELSDEKVLELSRILDINFYKITKVKVVC